jgi:hypothetical protein
MLDKELCEVIGVDLVERFFVNYIDNLDDKLAEEQNEEKKAVLLNKKSIMNNLRREYARMKQNSKTIRKC